MYVNVDVKENEILIFISHSQYKLDQKRFFSLLSIKCWLLKKVDYYVFVVRATLFYVKILKILLQYTLIASYFDEKSTTWRVTKISGYTYKNTYIILIKR